VPKYTMSQLRNKLKQVAAEEGMRLNNDYAKKLAARYLIEQRADQDLEDNGLSYNPLNHSDVTADKAIRAWFAALINQEVKEAA